MMRKKVTYCLIFILVSIVGLFSFSNSSKVKVDKFYKHLENSISVKIKKIKYDFENNNLLEGKLLSRGPIEERECIDDPGDTFYSKRYKYTVVNYGATYKTANGYDITLYLKNKSTYDLYFDMINIEDGSLKDDVYLNSGESINLSESFWCENGVAYNTDDCILVEDAWLNDKVKFEYKGKNIELPIEIHMYFSVYGDEESIKEVSVDNIEGRIHSEDLRQEIESIVGGNNVEKYLRMIDVSLSDDEYEKLLEESDIEETTQEPSENKNEEIVNIPDENLKKAIYMELGKDINTSITKAELETITSLDSGYSKNAYNDVGQIENIEGIQYCINLKELVLYGNNISDISILSELTNLEELSLGGNNISDISSLSGLTNLEKLYLDENNINDISVLSGLTNLKYLSLSSNNISDISSLSGLTNLKSFDLSFNNISDISSLSGLITLNELYLSENNINDISALSELINLDILYLDANNISDIKPLININSSTDELKEIYISKNRLNIEDEITMHVVTNLKNKGYYVELLN